LADAPGRGIRLRGRVTETIVVEGGLNDPMAIFLTIAPARLRARWGRCLVLDLGADLRPATRGGRPGRRPGLVWRDPVARRQRLSGSLSVRCRADGAHRRVPSAGTASHARQSGLAQPDRHVPAAGRAGHASRTDQRDPGRARSGGGAEFHCGPLVVAFCLAPFAFSRNERFFIAWVGLRGAVPIFLAIIPVVSLRSVDDNFFNIVFMVWLDLGKPLENPPSVTPRPSAPPLEKPETSV
jgi:potassium/hydrogen antiporter